MGSPKEPRPVKLFAALLLNSEDLLGSVEEDLIELFGSVDSSSRLLSWGLSEYYAKEMGTELLRRFISFGPLISPERLPETKLQTQTLERKYQWVRGEEEGRRVNIDPGYVDAGKVVLASTKSAGHRIYLRAGIYAEATLLYHDGSFQPFVYTYKDYLWAETISFFSALRSRYLSQLRRDN